MLLVARTPRTEAVPTRLLLVYVQLVVTAACLGLVFGFDDYPLTWLVLLPAIWAGMTMGPWTSAAYGLTVSLAVGGRPAGPGPGGPAPPTASDLVIIDSLMAAFVFVVLLLSLLRDQRAYLAGEVVRHRQEAIDQAGLLSTVFESISDALVLMDPSGVVQLHNGAAVELLGHERVEVEPARWLRRMHEQTSFTYSFNRDGSDEGLRVLSVQLADVQYAGADGIVAIARDVTTEQRRIEELTTFAAVAAHDLKSPLAAVQGWIEVAEDALGNDTITASQALERGRSASDRMSREIDDWLTYNVAREGSRAARGRGAAAGRRQHRRHLPRRRLPRGDARLGARRPDAAAPPAGEPRRQRGQVHPARARSPSSPSAASPPVTATGCGSTSSTPASASRRARRARSSSRSGAPRGVEAIYDGSGLGLALAKRIVRRHGGVISAEPQRGPGQHLHGHPPPRLSRAQPARHP